MRTRTMNSVRGTRLLLTWAGVALTLVATVLVGVEMVGLSQDTERILPVTKAPNSPIKLQIGEPTFIEAGDFDEDGNVDLVLITTAPIEQEGEPLTWKNYVILLCGDGKGDFGPPIWLHEAEWEWASFGGLVVDDLNQDGHLDFAVTDMANEGVWIFLGDGKGKLVKRFLQPGNPVVSTCILSADFNEDGHPDLAVTELLTRSIWLLWGDEKDGFTRVTTFPLEKGQEPYLIPVLMVTGDFNEDGHTDLAVLGKRVVSATVTYFVTALSTAGAEELKELSMTDVGEPGVSGTFVLAAGDYDRDGHLDLFTIRQEYTYTLWGLGNGEFLPRRGYRVFDPYPTKVILSDLNGDGCLNEIVFAWTIGKVFIRVGCYGGAGFSEPIPQWSPKTGVVADINNDGALDLVVANGGGTWTYLELFLNSKER